MDISRAGGGGEKRGVRDKRARADSLRQKMAPNVEIIAASGRGAMCTGRSMTGRTCGLYRRENAGMSSESHAGNMAVESPRFPGEGSSTQGKSGPKPRTEVVGDGQQVEIPALPRNEAVTQKDSSSAVMVNCVKVSSVGCS